MELKLQLDMLLNNDLLTIHKNTFFKEYMPKTDTLGELIEYSLECYHKVEDKEGYKK